VLQCVVVCCSVLLCVAVTLPPVPDTPKSISVSVLLLYSACMCYRVIKCVTACCRVLQCLAVCCSVLQCVAVHCSALQCAAMCCSVLQCVAVSCSVLQSDAE